MSRSSSQKKKALRVSVKYYKEEPKEKECLRLTEEEWSFISCPEHKLVPLAVCAAGRILKEKKKKETPEKFEKFKMGNQELGILLHLKYLGVLQSGGWEPTALFNHRIFITLKTFQNLRRPITEKNFY